MVRKSVLYIVLFCIFIIIIVIIITIIRSSNSSSISFVALLYCLYLIAQVSDSVHFPSPSHWGRMGEVSEWLSSA